MSVKHRYLNEIYEGNWNPKKGGKYQVIARNSVAGSGRALLNCLCSCCSSTNKIINIYFLHTEIIESDIQWATEAVEKAFIWSLETLNPLRGLRFCFSLLHYMDKHHHKQPGQIHISKNVENTGSRWYLWANEFSWLRTF